MKRKTYSSEKKYEEQEIIDGFRKGDRAVLKWAYQFFVPNIKGYIINRGGNGDDAALVIHETVVAIHLNIINGKYDSQHKFEKYFVKTAMNIWVGQQRKRQRRKEDTLAAELLNIPDENNFEEVSSHIQAQSQELANFKKAFALLKQLCQQLIKGYHLENKKYAQLAQELQLKEGNARVKTLRCRKNLKKLMLQF